jgi:regulator of protease activity HflC (stomatin/prohibitin superfamily)
LAKGRSLIIFTAGIDVRRTEAKGIQDFQSIASQGLSEQLLRWRWIEATKALAESQNAKVVVVGGKDGLPLILNTGSQGAKQNQQLRRKEYAAL